MSQTSVSMNLNILFPLKVSIVIFLENCNKLVFLVAQSNQSLTALSIELTFFCSQVV